MRYRFEPPQPHHTLTFEGQTYVAGDEVEVWYGRGAAELKLYHLVPIRAPQRDPKLVADELAALKAPKAPKAPVVVDPEDELDDDDEDDDKDIYR